MRTRNTFFLATLCVLYVALRVWRLDATCLWFDEIFSVHAAEQDWGALFTFVARDLIHPPLFYLVLKLWIHLGGDSVFWLRMLPVLFSISAIVPFVHFCRELKLREPVIYFALFLLAVNGALIKYTQTLRMYSMLMFLALLSMWLFARYFRRGKSFVWLVIANVLLIYTHYFGWLVIGTEIVAILWFQRIKWRRVVVMTAIAFAAFAPWLIATYEATRQGSDLAQNIAWQTRPAIRELFSFALDLVEPFYFQPSNAQPVSIYLISVPLLLIFIAGLIVYFVDWKSEEEKESVKLLLLFVLIPFVVAFVASWALPHSVWGTRHLIIILPPLLALAAHALLSLRIELARYIAVAVVIVVSGVAFVLNARREPPRHVWCAWNDVAAEIKETDAEPKTIYAFENLVAYHLWFALRNESNVQVNVIKGLDVQTDDETYFLPRGFDAVSTTDLGDVTKETIWLAFRTQKPGDEIPLIDNFRKLAYIECEGTNRLTYGRTTVLSVKMTRNAGVCERR